MQKVVSYNINHSRRTADGPYEAFDWKHRKTDVLNLLTRLSGAIMLIQEIPVEYVEEFKKQYPAYNWWHMNEPGRDGNFTAMAVGVINTLPAEFVANTSCGVWIKSGDMMIGCIHFPMFVDKRMAAVDEIIKFRNSHADVKQWIIGGDFNSFPDGRGPEQMIRLNAGIGSYSATEFAISRTTGNIALKSFAPYPYDYVPEAALRLYGKLDHILLIGIIGSDAMVEDVNRPNHNWAPSDHFPITVEVSPI